MEVKSRDTHMQRTVDMLDMVQDFVPHHNFFPHMRLMTLNDGLRMLTVKPHITPEVPRPPNEMEPHGVMPVALFAQAMQDQSELAAYKDTRLETQREAEELWNAICTPELQQHTKLDETDLMGLPAAPPRPGKPGPFLVAPAHSVFANPAAVGADSGSPAASRAGSVTPTGSRHSPERGASPAPSSAGRESKNEPLLGVPRKKKTLSQELAAFFNQRGVPALIRCQDVRQDLVEDEREARVFRGDDISRVPTCAFTDLQLRLEKVCDQANMSISQKIHMFVKYASKFFIARLHEALELWEALGPLARTRERLLQRYKEWEMTNLNDTAMFERTAADHQRMEKRRMEYKSQIEEHEPIILEKAEILFTNLNDVFICDGVNYVERMQNDFVNLLAHLKTIRASRQSRTAPSVLLDTFDAERPRGKVDVHTAATPASIASSPARTSAQPETAEESEAVGITVSSPRKNSLGARRNSLFSLGVSEPKLSREAILGAEAVVAASPPLQRTNSMQVGSRSSLSRTDVEATPPVPIKLKKKRAMLTVPKPAQQRTLGRSGSTTSLLAGRSTSPTSTMSVASTASSTSSHSKPKRKSTAVTMSVTATTSASTDESVAAVSDAGDLAEALRDVPVVAEPAGAATPTIAIAAVEEPLTPRPPPLSQRKKLGERPHGFSTRLLAKAKEMDSEGTLRVTSDGSDGAEVPVRRFRAATFNVATPKHKPRVLMAEMESGKME
eukprot:TRINITY_DN1936_c0_g2_i1.p1 TRINITY_DN1936_c0_g2~~TRINITY_DN1936_c0_g2_i1.p1  ORF type:complete len:797 (-),score=185.53 TRINITY_DN1936_c0_g2_i1:111-2294(-)